MFPPRFYTLDPSPKFLSPKRRMTCWFIQFKLTAEEGTFSSSKSVLEMGGLRAHLLTKVHAVPSVPKFPVPLLLFGNMI